MVSDDSFKFQGKIYYNDLSPHMMRQRFSLMHELGHITLNHVGTSRQNEDEADLFSSHILAPRVAIHKLNCRDAQQIHDTFHISYQAANRALADYYIWFRHICQTTRKPSLPEQQIEHLLFPPTPDVSEETLPREAKAPPKKMSKAAPKASQFQECTEFFNDMQELHGTDPMYLHAESQLLYEHNKRKYRKT